MAPRSRPTITARMRWGPAAAKGASRGSADPMTGKGGQPGTGKIAGGKKAAGKAEKPEPTAKTKGNGQGMNGRVPAAAKGPAGRQKAEQDGPGSDTEEGSPGSGGLLRRLARIPAEAVVLGVLAAVTRLAFVFHPRTIVFDEVYFREYALHYKDGTYYFDLHPPLGKLLLALWAKLVGVDATVADKDPAVAMRILPALAGAALIVVFYLLLRELCGNRKVATLGAGLLLLDNALLVESRFILVDSMLLLFGFGALTLFLAARRRTGRAYWAMLTGSAVLAGMCAATKLTGLAVLGLMGLHWFVKALRERVPWKRAVTQGAVLTVVPFVLYLSTFAIHFALLPKAGPGDAYMSQKFQSTLVGNANHTDAAHMSFPGKFLELNRAIRDYEHSLDTSTHPYQSSWTSWPLMKRGVFYHTADAGDGKTEYIYLLGNPVVWWGTLFGILVVALGWISRPDLFAPHREMLGLLGVGWVASYLPFAFIERPMFLYHYFFPLMFSLAAVVIGVGILAGWIGSAEERGERRPFEFSSRGSAIAYWGILGVALLAFLYFAPITYGTPLTTDGLMDRMWLSTWR